MITRNDLKALILDIVDRYEGKPSKVGATKLKGTYVIECDDQIIRDELSEMRHFVPYLMYQPNQDRLPGEVGRISGLRVIRVPGRNATAIRCYEKDHPDEYVVLKIEDKKDD